MLCKARLGWWKSPRNENLGWDLGRDNGREALRMTKGGHYWSGGYNEMVRGVKSLLVKIPLGK
jgi:hypothetical protein